MIQKKNARPADVFTPRAAKVNQSMYIDRSELESELKNHALGTRHLIVHGESGNGKTWLYKKVFSDMELPYTVVNLANASRFESLKAAFKDKATKKSSGMSISGKVINRNASASILGVRGGISDQMILTAAEEDPLEALMSLVHKEAGDKKALIVLDNFEQILGSKELVKEISDSLILLDDEDYAKFNVKFCLVGVPSDIREYLSKQNSLETISNRVVEISEVARLTSCEAKLLLKCHIPEGSMAVS